MPWGMIHNEPSSVCNGDKYADTQKACIRLRFPFCVLHCAMHSQFIPIGLRAIHSVIDVLAIHFAINARLLLDSSPLLDRSQNHCLIFNFFFFLIRLVLLLLLFLWLRRFVSCRKFTHEIRALNHQRNGFSQIRLFQAKVRSLR